MNIIITKTNFGFWMSLWNEDSDSDKKYYESADETGEITYFLQLIMKKYNCNKFD